MRTETINGQPFRLERVSFTVNGILEHCYDARIPWPKAALGLPSADAHLDYFASNAPCFVESLSEKMGEGRPTTGQGMAYEVSQWMLHR